MKEMLKKLMRFYWHHSQAYSLMSLPVNGIGTVSSLLVLFTVVTGIRFAAWVYLAFFIVGTAVLFFLGMIAKRMGLLTYWQSLNNSQNVELMEIHTKIQGITSSNATH